MSPHLFLGGGFNFLFGWWFYFDFLGDYFLRGIFCVCVFCVGSLFIFVGEVYLYLFNIHIFIHTILVCTVGRCKCWTVCFFVFGHKHVA